MNPAAKDTPLRQLIAAGEHYATLLQAIRRPAMRGSGRDAIDDINKRINAAVDNVFGFDIPE